MTASSTAAINIRLACFERSKERSRWPHLVARWLQGPRLDAPDATSFEGLLYAAESILLEVHAPSLPHLESIASALNTDMQSLMYEDRLVERPDWVLTENLRRLLVSSKSGEGNLTTLANHLGVNPSTISRWKRGIQAPDRATQMALIGLFHLPANTDLRLSPVFLSYSPVTHSERLAWAATQLEKLSPSELHALFPALRKVLS